MGGGMFSIESSNMGGLGVVGVSIGLAGPNDSLPWLSSLDELSLFIFFAYKLLMKVIFVVKAVLLHGVKPPTFLVHSFCNLYNALINKLSDNQGYTYTPTRWATTTPKFLHSCSLFRLFQ